MEMASSASSRVVTVVGGGIDFRPPVGDDLGWDADDEVCLSVGIGAESEMIGWSRIRSAERKPFEKGSKVCTW